MVVGVIAKIHQPTLGRGWRPRCVHVTFAVPLGLFIPDNDGLTRRPRWNVGICIVSCHGCFTVQADASPGGLIAAQIRLCSDHHIPYDVEVDARSRSILEHRAPVHSTTPSIRKFLASKQYRHTSHPSGRWALQTRSSRMDPRRQPDQDHISGAPPGTTARIGGRLQVGALELWSPVMPSPRNKAIAAASHGPQRRCMLCTNVPSAPSGSLVSLISPKT